MSGNGLDLAALRRYLRDRLPGFDDVEVDVDRFPGGQSNPTYRLQTGSGEYVLRTKPGGTLLATAHAIDREYRVMTALADSEVPVPRVHVFCDDADAIGREFYVMEFVAGDVHRDATLPGLTPAQRSAIWRETVGVLARLHQIDHVAIGLQTFGRPDGYLARQVDRWSRQYASSKVEDNADMDRLVGWLQAHDVPRDEVAIVHGDYRTHNVIVDTDVSRITAVVDWELSTIGHPLADLAYCCLPYHLPPEDTVGFRGADLAELGIPSEQELLDVYCRATGRSGLADWGYFVVFAMFRMAAIRAGILQRAHAGNAANAHAVEAGLRYRITAERGWALASELG